MECLVSSNAMRDIILLIVIKSSLLASIFPIRQGVPPGSQEIRLTDSIAFFWQVS
jgi:hypothetical protein